MKTRIALHPSSGDREPIELVIWFGQSAKPESRVIEIDDLQAMRLGAALIDEARRRIMRKT